MLNRALHDQKTESDVKLVENLHQRDYVPCKCLQVRMQNATVALFKGVETGQ